MSINDKDYVPYEGEDMQRYIERVMAVEPPTHPARPGRPCPCPGGGIGGRGV